MALSSSSSANMKGERYPRLISDDETNTYNKTPKDETVIQSKAINISENTKKLPREAASDKEESGKEEKNLDGSYVKEDTMISTSSHAQGMFNMKTYAARHFVIKI